MENFDLWLLIKIIVMKIQENGSTLQTIVFWMIERKSSKIIEHILSNYVNCGEKRPGFLYYIRDTSGVFSLIRDVREKSAIYFIG